jgi:hypothetical protein
MLLGMLILACKEPEEKETVAEDTAVIDTDTGDTGEPVVIDGFSGEITIDSAGLVGTFSIEKAFGMAVDDTLIVYLSSNPDATCERVVRYLTPSSELEDPSDLRLGQTCDMFMKISSWDGSFSAKDDRLAIASSAISCVLDDGKFIYKERGTDDFDYYWSGRWWQGIPDLYTLSIEDSTKSDGFEISGEMSSFDGAFIYEKLQSEPGSGLVSGAADIELCEDFKPLFKIY